MKELWDLYDSSRKLLPEKHIRGHRLRAGTYHISVGIWTVNCRGELLLTLRSPEKHDWPDMWENTAGSILSGESSRQGAVRELYEETGIAVSSKELCYLGTEHVRNTIADCYIVRKSVPIEELKLQAGETCDAKWVTLDELDKMIEVGLVAPPVSARLKKIRKKVEEFIMNSTENKENYLPIKRADILLPEKVDERWAVVACDQYTSQREYWEELEGKLGDCPSTLKMIFPEVYLEDGDGERRIANANSKMKEYLDIGVFKEYKDSMIFTERTLPDGRVRKGIVALLDLDAYSYENGATSLIRATEGTVLSRIPPRVKIRENAPLELPHIMVLVDDIEDGVVPSEISGEVVYDTDLVMGGGHIRGSLMSDEAIEKTLSALRKKTEGRENPMLFAVGDGNHSLATAKACRREDNPLSRYALAEIVNIHSDALDFEPIYRVMFGCNPEDVLAKAKERFSDGEHEVKVCFGDSTEIIYVNGLVSGTLQDFIDEYISLNSGVTVDYIHGEQTVYDLSRKEGSIGFIFDGISKSELFPYVEKNGSLPRKTFSMGHAYDKRYYMECRRIK